LVTDASLNAFSLVCKPIKADGQSTVKLSDNLNKAMGSSEEIDRYKRVFGVGQQKSFEILV
jgi:nicotinate phosphoribosyltransferase